MSLIEELKGLGVDVSEGLDRVMGDNDLYEMMLGMFIDAVNNNPVSLEEFAGGSLDGLIGRIHTLKGITGNLAMTQLFMGYTEALTLLRAGQPKEAREKYEALLPAQAAVLECIRRHTSAQ